MSEDDVTTPVFALWGVAFTAVLASVVRDLRDRIIPNVLVLVVCAAGVAMQIFSEGWSVWYVFLAAAVVYLCSAALAHWGFIGGGDAKLIIASSLLVPPGQVVPLMLSIALAGGLLSCFYLAAKAVLARSAFDEMQGGGEMTEGAPISEFLRTEANRILAGEPMPYAVAILGGLAFHFVVEVI